LRKDVFSTSHRAWPRLAEALVGTKGQTPNPQPDRRRKRMFNIGSQHFMWSVLESKGFEKEI